MKKLLKNYRLLLFYWFVAFSIAVLVYYLLALVSNRVFGSWYRMIGYHYEHPIQYIAIPVFFYGIIATYFSQRFYQSKRKIGFTLLIVVLTIVVSSPFGGMLWHFHDMQAGWFPKNWIDKLLGGITDGLGIGWLLILLSFPYNILGIAVAYFLTDYGSKRFFSND